MPRDGRGNYSLPELPFVPGNTISSAAVNDDLSDIASAMTDSVAADGQTSMTGPLKLSSGSSLAPAITFASSLLDGFFSSAAGVIGVALGGVLAFLIKATGIQNANGAQVSVPVGTVVDFAGAANVVPPGWFLCAGQTFPRTSPLFAVIGVTYGIGDGSTTANLPDYRGRHGYGIDNMNGTAAGRIGTVVTDSGTIVGTTLGSTGGSATHAQTGAEVGQHNHGITDTHTHSLPNVSQASNNPGSNARNADSGSGSGGTVPSTGTANGGSIVVNNSPAAAAMSLLTPGLMVNKIIFAGAP